MKLANSLTNSDGTGDTLAAVPILSNHVALRCLTLQTGVPKIQPPRTKPAEKPRTCPEPRERSTAGVADPRGSQRSLTYHLYTLWLFTRSDLKTVLIPQLFFALSNTLSGHILTPNPTPTFTQSSLPTRLLCAAAWIWLNLLTEVMANQRLPASITEDALNKPWRPLSSGRLTPDQARRLLLLLVVPSALALSWVLGVMGPSVGLVVLTWLYNDLGGAGEECVLRNVLNAAGLLCFGMGATSIVGGVEGGDLTMKGRVWFGVVGAVIATTVHVQDLPDMEGDRARDRKTVPLIWGERVARNSAAGMVAVWSLVCPLFWNARMAVCAVFGLAGMGLGVWIVWWRGVEADRVAWRLWCIWMMGLFALPLCAGSNAFPLFECFVA